MRFWDSKADEVVSDGYMNFLNCVKYVGELSMILFYQTFAPMVFHRPNRYIYFGPMILFPLVLLPFMFCRARVTSDVEVERKDRQVKVLSFKTFLVRQYRLVTDYSMRTGVVNDSEQVVRAYNVAASNESSVFLNNTYFCPWVSVCCEALYIYIVGLQILHQGTTFMTLGMFVTNVKIVTDIGQSYGDIYKTVLKMQSTLDSLRHIVWIMNLPTDLKQRAVACAGRRLHTKQMREDLVRKYPHKKSGLMDMEPIVISNVNFSYQPGPGRLTSRSTSFQLMNTPSEGSCRTLLLQGYAV